MVAGKVGINLETASQFAAFGPFEGFTIVFPVKLLLYGLLIYSISFVLIGLIVEIVRLLLRKRLPFINGSGWHAGWNLAFLIIFYGTINLQVKIFKFTPTVHDIYWNLVLVIMAIITFAVVLKTFRQELAITSAIIMIASQLSWWLFVSILESTASLQYGGVASYFVYLSAGILFSVLLLFMAQKKLIRNPEQSRQKAIFYSKITMLIFLVELSAGTIWMSSHWHSKMDIGKLTARGEKPNILLIVMDTVRADHLSSYGHFRPTTPTIDKLAKEGVLFENVMSVAHWTLTSHASVFTGLHPGEHLTNSKNRYLGFPFPTIAQVLAEVGYDTACFSANPFVTPKTGLERGFKHFDGIESNRRFFIAWKIYLDSIKRYNPWRKYERPFKPSGQVIDHAMKWLKTSYDAETPFFVFINLMDGHMPYLPPSHKGLDRFFSDKTQYLKALRTNEDYIAYLTGKVKMTEGDFELLKTLYDAQIRYMDDQLARLFQYLENTGYWKNTVVIVMSDHGDYFGERGLMGHGLGVGYSTLRIPLVIGHLPGMEKGKHIKELAQSIDIVPTILEVLNIDWATSNHLPGTSLLKLKEHRAGFADAYHQPKLLEALRTYGNEEIAKKFDRQTVVIWKDNYEYIWTSNGDKELYYLPDDPAEKNNLLGVMPELAAQMDFVAEKRARRSSGIPEQHMDVELSPEEKERLKALGYVW